MHLVWYLLYPFRGTTDPPKFRHESPIRRAFYRHGALTARHWLLAMLASVAIGVIFSYPSLFMTDFPSGAIAGLPHHVWTGPSSFELRTEKQPDLEMRQVWLQGDYMQALNKSLLRQTFVLQDLLLGNLRVESDASTWGLQSPASYWNYSLDLFDADSDPLQTISRLGQDAVILGFDLQPMSAFAGKQFTQGSLTGADALIITLIYRQTAEVGDLWRRNLIDLPQRAPSHWNIGVLPSDSSIYQYKFQPFSFRQYWALVGAYLCVVIYVSISLKRLKAFRSRAGLVVTAITQMTTSILASFTICGLLRINLDQIPPEAYPFVVLSIGLENIFRLINAVLAYPPEMATEQRIANGVADVGAASLASAVQNLAILWILSLFVSPGVAAFCVFAAVALLFDFFFLITFFLAVLNVDIKRLELQDSLVRSKGNAKEVSTPIVVKKKTPKHVERVSWVQALLRGRLPFSTRMAGSVITVTFIMALNWHFSDRSMSALRMSPWSSPRGKKYSPTTRTEQDTLRSTNQTLLPASSRDINQRSSHAEAHFMHVIKPGVKSFIAKIYDPLVIILDDADRTSVPVAHNHLLYALRDVAIRHFYPFALAVVFVVAFVTVLMNFLLWDQRTEALETELAASEDGPLSYSVIETSHTLDIVQVDTDGRGRILTVGLDHQLGLTARDTTCKSYSKLTFQTQNSENEQFVKAAERYLVNAIRVHPDEGKVAFLCQDGCVLVGDLTNSSLPSVRAIGTGSDRKVVMFDYASDATSGPGCEELLILSEDGKLEKLRTHQSNISALNLNNEEGRLICAELCKVLGSGPRIFVLTELGSICSYISSPESDNWIIAAQAMGAPSLNIPAPTVHEAWLHAIPLVGSVLLCTPEEATLIGVESMDTQLTIPLGFAKRKSVRFLVTEVSKCSRCAATTCASFAVAFVDAINGDLRVHKYGARLKDGETGGSANKADIGEAESTSICLSSTVPEGCLSMKHLHNSEHRLTSPGSWEATESAHIVGLRRTPTNPPHVSSKSTSSSTVISASATKARGAPSTEDSPLRRRRRISASEYMETRSNGWEAYSLSMDGELNTIAVKEPGMDSETQLFADDPGPAVKFDYYSVGVAIGNSVIVIQVNDTSGVPDAGRSKASFGLNRSSSGGFDRLIENGRDSAAREALGKGTIGVRRSASRSKRGAAASNGLEMSKKVVREA
ncbi:Sterol regulatory element-binding protein cleavage-activating protein [Sphaceloma murrayae]|uniref:Sterol regulatory element-binding protein cleavage-activating protein n=1 Tax=Sphaceloma murrayae TaxID=2082308 RepID=A0A2K1QMI5_9PEZI|nr:Sterol regulatory element-binding protein cleavage-activating protein [Sphaceloma murrayae]